MKELFDVLRTRPALQQFADSLEASIQIEDIESIQAAFNDLDLSALDEHDVRVLAQVRDQFQKALLSILGQVAKEVGIEETDLPSGAYSEEPATLDIAMPLSMCVGLAEQITGGEEDEGLVLAMLQLGFADSLVSIEAEQCNREERSFERDWEVVAAAANLAKATTHAIEALVEAEHVGVPLTLSELSGLVDPAMHELLKYFPSIVDGHASKMASEVDNFLDSL